MKMETAQTLRRKARNRRRLPLFLSFICGALVVSQCIMIGGMAWVGKMRNNSFELNMQAENAQAHIRFQKNENFKKWLIDGGNYKNYMTMEEAWRGFKEFGDEVKLKRDRDNYKQEVLRMLKERAQEV